MHSYKSHNKGDGHGHDRGQQEGSNRGAASDTITMTL